jgi:hypothetical protein
MTDFAKALSFLVGRYGAWGLLLAVILFVILFDEKAERVSGWILGLFSWSSNAIRRRSIKASIQGRVSEFARKMNKEAEGSLPYNVRLEFVSEVDRALLDPEASTVIVKIRNRGDTDQNLVHTMLAFAPVGCVPMVRPYLDGPLSRAIDVTVTRRFLTSTRQYSALQYLPVAVNDRERATGGVDTLLYSALAELDERGIFTRAFLAEMRDLGVLLHTQHPTTAHAEEVSSFLAYLEKVANKKPNEDMPQRGYKGRYIATAFVFVGRVETMQESGEKRYLDHIGVLRDAGFLRVFLAARFSADDITAESFSSATARGVASRAEVARLASIVKEMTFPATDADGTRRTHLLIELALLGP